MKKQCTASGGVAVNKRLRSVRQVMDDVPFVMHPKHREIMHRLQRVSEKPSLRILFVDGCVGSGKSVFIDMLRRHAQTTDCPITIHPMEWILSSSGLHQQLQSLTELMFARARTPFVRCRDNSTGLGSVRTSFKVTDSSHCAQQAQFPIQPPSTPPYRTKVDTNTNEPSPSSVSVTARNAHIIRSRSSKRKIDDCNAPWTSMVSRRHRLADASPGKPQAEAATGFPSDFYVFDNLDALMDRDVIAAAFAPPLSEIVQNSNELAGNSSMNDKTSTQSHSMFQHARRFAVQLVNAMRSGMRRSRCTRNAPTDRLDSRSGYRQQIVVIICNTESPDAYMIPQTLQEVIRIANMDRLQLEELTPNDSRFRHAPSSNGSHEPKNPGSRPMHRTASALAFTHDTSRTYTLSSNLPTAASKYYAWPIEFIQLHTAQPMNRCQDAHVFPQLESWVRHFTVDTIEFQKLFVESCRQAMMDTNEHSTRMKAHLDNSSHRPVLDTRSTKSCTAVRTPSDAARIHQTELSRTNSQPTESALTSASSSTTIAHRNAARTIATKLVEKSNAFTKRLNIEMRATGVFVQALCGAISRTEVSDWRSLERMMVNGYQPIQNPLRFRISRSDGDTVTNHPGSKPLPCPWLRLIQAWRKDVGLSPSSRNHFMDGYASTVDNDGLELYYNRKEWSFEQLPRTRAVWADWLRWSLTQDSSLEWLALCAQMTSKLVVAPQSHSTCGLSVPAQALHQWLHYINPVPMGHSLDRYMINVQWNLFRNIPSIDKSTTFGGTAPHPPNRRRSVLRNEFTSECSRDHTLQAPPSLLNSDRHECDALETLAWIVDTCNAWSDAEILTRMAWKKQSIEGDWTQQAQCAIGSAAWTTVYHPHAPENPSFWNCVNSSDRIKFHSPTTLARNTTTQKPFRSGSNASLQEPLVQFARPMSVAPPFRRIRDEMRRRFQTALDTRPTEPSTPFDRYTNSYKSMIQQARDSM